MESRKKLNRREVLRTAAFGLAGTGLAAYAKPSDRRASSGKVSISYGTPGGTVENAHYKPVFDAWNSAHPNVRANYVAYGGNYTTDSVTKVQTLMAGGDAPDAVWIPPEYVASFASRGAIVPIDHYLKNTKLDLNTIFPVHLDALRWKGKLWGLPRDGAPLSLFYNIPMFDAAHVPYPTENWTWDDYLSAGKELTHRDANGRATQIGADRGDWTSWVWQAGGDILSHDGKRCVLDSAAAVSAFKFMRDLVVKYKVAPTNEDVPGISYSSFLTSNTYSDEFVSNRIAMMVGNRGVLPNVCSAKFDFGVAPLPKGKKHATLVPVGCNVIWAGSKHKQDAVDFIAYQDTDEAQRLRLSNGFGFPCIKAALSQPWYSQYTCSTAKDDSGDSAFATELEKGWVRTYPTNPKYAQIATTIGNNLDALFLGQQSAEEVAKSMVQQVNGILGGT